MNNTVYIANAFSLQMLEGSARLQITQVSDPRAFLAPYTRSGWDIASAMGHADIARIAGRELGIELPMNRVSIRLTPGVYRGSAYTGRTELLVAQYTGPRLPEGATELPQGVTITWWHVAHKA